MKSRHIIFIFACISLFSTQCKKSNGPDPSTAKTPSLFHRDITIHETVKYGEEPQKTLGLFQPGSDPAQLIYVATRGRGEPYAMGFRIGGLSKDSSISWIKSYALPGTMFQFQYCTTAVMDHDDNILIGGNVFPSASFSYGSPFLVKLSKSGDILWSKQTADTNWTSRGLVLKILRNGDIAYVTYFGGSYFLYRLDANGNTIWAKTIYGNNGLGPSGYVQEYGANATISQMLEETSDGSIFFGFASNEQYPDGQDCLLKFSASGNLLLSKSFVVPGGESHQPALLVTENDDIIYFNQKSRPAKPYFLLLSINMETKMMKVCDLPVIPWNNVEQLNYSNGKIYLSTAGTYELCSYTFDGSLNLLSSVKTLATDGFSAEYGGVYTVDPSRNAVYSIQDLAGMQGDGNGFQFLKTDMKGLSCHPYADPVVPMELSSITTILNDLTLTVADASFPFSKNLNWTASPIRVTSSETACSKN
jgi:hypothetical protein